MKHQIASLVKAATASAVVAFIQAIDADAPSAWMDAPIWPVIGAISTFAIAEVNRWAKS